jgi:hypothetical protein
VKTFRESYCEKHRCGPEAFERKVFWRCLYRHAWLIAPVIMLFNESYFAADWDLISRVGDSASRRRVKEEIDDYFHHPTNTGWVRLGLRVRLSSHALRSLARQYLDEPLAGAESETGSGPPWPKP